MDPRTEKEIEVFQTALAALKTAVEKTGSPSFTRESPPKGKGWTGRKTSFESRGCKVELVGVDKTAARCSLTVYGVMLKPSAWADAAEKIFGLAKAS
jgi:hypothetical protein